MDIQTIKNNIADMEAAHAVGDESEKAALTPIIESAKNKLRELEDEGKSAAAKTEKPSAAKKTTTKAKPKTAGKTPAKKTMAKPQPTKSDAANKTVPAKPKVASPPSGSVTLLADWGEKVYEYEKLERVQYKGGFYMRVLGKNERAELRIGDAKHLLEPHEAILMNDKGYPVTFLTAESVKNRTVPYEEAITKADYDKILADLKKTKDQVVKLEKQLARPKPQPAKAVPVKAEKPAEPAKATEGQGDEAKKPKASCGLGKGQAAKAGKGETPAPALAWLIGMVEAWKAKGFHGKIVRMYFDEKTEKIYVRMAWYDPIWRKVGYNKRSVASHSLHSVCINTGDIRKSNIERNMQLLANQEYLDSLYSTRDNYSVCRQLIRKAAKACMGGNCTAEAREMYSKFYHECGDDVAKEKHIEYQVHVHALARKEWIKGQKKEPYLTVLKGVAKRIKTKATKA